MIWVNECLLCSSAIGEAVACSHGRAHVYFTESILTDCPFTAYPCDSYVSSRVLCFYTFSQYFLYHFWDTPILTAPLFETHLHLPYSHTTLICTCIYKGILDRDIFDLCATSRISLSPLVIECCNERDNNRYNIVWRIYNPYQTVV